MSRPSRTSRTSCTSRTSPQSMISCDVGGLTSLITPACNAHRSKNGLTQAALQYKKHIAPHSKNGLHCNPLRNSGRAPLENPATHHLKTAPRQAGKPGRTPLKNRTAPRSKNRAVIRLTQKNLPAKTQCSRIRKINVNPFFRTKSCKANKKL